MKPIILLALLSLALSLTYARAGDTPVNPQDWYHVNAMLAALAADDYEAFCKQGAPALRTNVPKERFESLAIELRPRLLDGYRLSDKGTFGYHPGATLIWVLELHRDSKNPEEVLLTMPKPDNGDPTDFRLLR